ncbi:hypothetical protein AGOR_G00079780 [Albula goreensis]|uniref:Uncharacterized protein n=1 Tax=Albula goreensis TaxID=1534307 RepID=A0A8T3DIL8_9TELE|nr:hypothetical protein AGOR_G00079780 [Albula goreensis]
MGNQQSHVIQDDPVNVKQQNGGPNGHAVSISATDAVVACETAVQANSEPPSSTPVKEPSPQSGDAVDGGALVGKPVVLLSFTKTTPPSADVPKDPSKQPDGTKASVEEDAGNQSLKPAQDTPAEPDPAPKEEEPKQNKEKIGFFAKAFKKKNKEKMEKEPAVVQCDGPPEDQKPTVEVPVVLTNGLHSETSPSLDDQRDCVRDDTGNPPEEAISSTSATNFEPVNLEVPEDPTFHLASLDSSLEVIASLKLETDPSCGEDAESGPSIALAKEEVCTTAGDEKDGFVTVAAELASGAECKPHLVIAEAETSESLPPISTGVLEAKTEEQNLETAMELSLDTDVRFDPEMDTGKTESNSELPESTPSYSAMECISPKDIQATSCDCAEVGTEESLCCHVEETSLSKEDEMEDGCTDTPTMVSEETESVLLITAEELPDVSTAEPLSDEIIPSELAEEGTLQKTDKLDLESSRMESLVVSSWKHVDGALEREEPKFEDNADCLQPAQNSALPEAEQECEAEPNPSTECEAGDGKTTEDAQLQQDNLDVEIDTISLEPVTSEISESLEPDSVEPTLDSDIDICEPKNNQEQLEVQSDSMTSNSIIQLDSTENTETESCNIGELSAEDSDSTLTGEESPMQSESELTLVEEETEALQMLTDTQLTENEICQCSSSECIEMTVLDEDNKPKSEDELDDSEPAINSTISEHVTASQLEMSPMTEDVAANESISFNAEETSLSNEEEMVEGHMDQLITLTEEQESVLSTASEDMADTSTPEFNTSGEVSSEEIIPQELDVETEILQATESTVQLNSTEDVQTAPYVDPEVFTEENLSSPIEETKLTTEDEMEAGSNDANMVQEACDSESILASASEEGCEPMSSAPASTKDFSKDRIPQSEDELACLEPENKLEDAESTSLQAEPSNESKVTEESETTTLLDSTTEISATLEPEFTETELCSSAGAEGEDGGADEAQTNSATDSNTVSCEGEEEVTQRELKSALPEVQSAAIPLTVQSETHENAALELSPSQPCEVVVTVENEGCKIQDEMQCVKAAVTAFESLPSDSGVDSDSAEEAESAASQYTNQDPAQGGASITKDELSTMTEDDIEHATLLLLDEVTVLEVALQL